MRKSLLVLGLLAQIAALWAIDFYSGYELRTGILYALAVAYASWHLGLIPAVATSVVCASLGYLAERGSGAVYSEAWIGYANAGGRLAFLLFVALSIAHFRRTLDFARRKVRAFTGPVPICTQCQQLCSPDGQWSDFQTYVLAHTEATWQPKVCPQCARRAYARSG